MVEYMRKRIERIMRGLKLVRKKYKNIMKWKAFLVMAFLWG